MGTKLAVHPSESSQIPLGSARSAHKSSDALVVYARPYPASNHRASASMTTRESEGPFWGPSLAKGMARDRTHWTTVGKRGASASISWMGVSHPGL